MVALTQEKLGKSPQGAKTCFCYQCKAAFRPLILHRFRPFLNNRRESLSACVHQWKIFQFLHRGFSRTPKQPKIRYSRQVFVIELQLKRHNCGRWESFQGLVDIPRMCLLYMSFGGDVLFGSYKPKFWRLHYMSWPNRITAGLKSNGNRLPLGTFLYSYNRQQLVTTMSTRERLQRDRATPETTVEMTRQFNITRKAAASVLFEPILQCAPRHIATRLP